MFRAQTTQHEWLLEDLEQIQRYFPGAELLEALETPFDIQTRTWDRQREKKENERTARAVAEEAAGGVRAAHERQRHEHPKRSKLLLKNDCVSLGAFL